VPDAEPAADAADVAEHDDLGLRSSSTPLEQDATALNNDRSLWICSAFGISISPNADRNTERRRGVGDVHDLSVSFGPHRRAHVVWRR
jgi:hypothetical protein